jgi:hypothetical protein
MWHNRYITDFMRGLLVPPLAVAGAALAGPVFKDDLHVGPDHGPQFGHHFNAGTASALTRPPGGYWHEQPLPKSAYQIVSPTIDYESEAYVVVRYSDDRITRLLG